MGNLINKELPLPGDVIVITKYGAPVADNHARYLNRQVVVKEVVTGHPGRWYEIVVLPPNAADGFVLFPEDEWKYVI